MTIRRTAAVWIILFLCFISACAVRKPLPPPKAEDIDRLSQTYLQRAESAQEKGEAVQALKYYKLLHILKADDHALASQIKGLESALRNQAETHYKKGVDHLKAYNLREGHRELLIALRLRPDHTDALEALKKSRTDQPGTYIRHKIQPGETLSKIALRYYGKNNYKILQGFNAIADVRRIKAGQVIRIPVIRIGNRYRPDIKAAPPEAKPDKKEKQPDQTVIYRSAGITLFKESKYQEAIVELEKALGNVPEDAETRDYLHKCHLEQGKILAKNGNDDAASEAFRAALRYNPDCAVCKKYTDKKYIDAAPEKTPLQENSPETYTDLFDQGKYSEAIAILGPLYDEAPDDETVREYLYKSYLEQGNRLLEKDDSSGATEAFRSALRYSDTCDICRERLETAIRQEAANLEAGISLFKEKKYTAAITKLKRFHEIHPEDRTASEYLYKSHFELAVNLFGKYQRQKDKKADALKAAEKELKRAFQYKDECEACLAYEENYKSRRYLAGQTYLSDKGNEKINEALEAWHQVRFVDPAYKSVQKNIGEAEHIREKLAELNDK